MPRLRAEPQPGGVRVFLGKPPLEPPCDRNPANLSPEYLLKHNALMSGLKGRGLPAVLIEGRRTQERQRWLWAQGREWGVKGETVTNRDGSKPIGHMLGRCGDYWKAGTDGRAIRIANDHPWWMVFGEEVERLGLIWGGRWHHLGDLDHAELP